ncbi:MAG: phosphatase PAP2 family protein [Chloroflexota bacterium]|nr:phosphatase PAP2 family protein [Chloroflexota bacterium]
MLLVLSALPLRRRGVTDIEADIFYGINDVPGFLFWPIWAVMQLGNIVTVPVVAAVMLMLRRVRLAIDVVVAGSSAWLLATVIKSIVARGRLGEILTDVILRSAPASGHGYVSGHAAVAAAMAAVITPYVARPWKIVVWSLAVIVGLARVYVGAHLPLDVVGGAVMGWAIGSLVHFLLGEPERTLPGRVAERGRN